MRIIFLAASLMACVSIVYCADFPCPPAIHAEQNLSSPVQGWRVTLDPAKDSLGLTAIELYEGPPEEMANLKPDNGDAMGSEGWIWTLYPTAGHRIWEVCKYYGTAVRLTRELPETVKTCQVIPLKEPARRIDTLRCK